MTKDDMAKVMEAIFRECQDLRNAGQKEYAHEETNAFGNFERIGKELGLRREQILFVYARKHWDGIIAHVTGHKSQREDVRGRINDLIVYLCLFRGMVEEDLTAKVEP